jgi:uncharacterized protein YkwD
MDLWLNSTEHRQNLLMPRYRDVGMALVTGTFHGSRSAHIWVAQFGYHHGALPRSRASRWVVPTEKES